MKTLTLILLTFISFIFAKQIFVKTGTGLKGVSLQWKLPGMKEGCLFMAACAIGGLGSDKEMLSARKWAVSKGYIRGSDTYVNMSGMELARRIAQNYKTQFEDLFQRISSTIQAVEFGTGNYTNINNTLLKNRILNNDI